MASTAFNAPKPPIRERARAILKRLSGRGWKLGEALDAHEEAVALASDCPDRLEEAGRRVSEPSMDGDRNARFCRINLLLGTLMQAYAEALVFGDEHGLSLDYMRDVIASSPVGAPLFEYKGPSWRTATSRSNSPSISY